MGSTRRAFTAEYKDNAVSLVVGNGRMIADVARGVDVKPQTLGHWVKKASDEQPRSAELSKTEREELEMLRVENAGLKMKLEFAKKCRPCATNGRTRSCQRRLNFDPFSTGWFPVIVATRMDCLRMAGR